MSFLCFVADMSDTSSDFNCDVDATGETEQEGTNAKEEIFLIIRPYLRVKSTETEEKLKGKLNEMGVSNMSHLSILDEKDFKGLITVADFRLMMKKIIQTNASGKCITHHHSLIQLIGLLYIDTSASCCFSWIAGRGIGQSTLRG